MILVLKFSNFNLSYNPKKCVSVCVCVCVCVSSASSVCSTIWIFFKFCTKSRKNGTIWLTEPDFWFRTLFRTYCPKSVKNGRFSRFLANISKTALTILMIFWYVVDLIVGYYLTVVTCLAKILFGSYSVRKLSEKVSSVRGHFLRWFLSYFKKADIFWHRSMFELLPYQISDHFNHPVKSYGRPKTAKIDLFSKR